MLRVRLGTACLMWVSLLAGAQPRPAWATEADDLCAPSDDPCRVTTRVTVMPMSVIDVGQRELLIEGGGALAVGTGQMNLRAGSLRVASNGSLLAQGTAAQNGGIISVEAGAIVVEGRIDVTGSSGGAVMLVSDGTLSVSGAIDASRISNEGSGGEIVLRGSTATVSGNLIAAGGNFGFGGDVSIEATGDVTYSGRIDVRGEEGGNVEFTAGLGDGGGNVVLAESALIEADSRTAGGFGGMIDIDARGDGVATGNVTVDGVLSAGGGSGTAETTGGDGGSISVTAIGNIVAAARGARIRVEGGRPDGFGGDVELLAAEGSLSYGGQISIGPLGSAGGGGDLTIDVGGVVTLSGSIAGPGGSEALINAAGDITVTQSGTINLNDGGSLCLDAGQAGLAEPSRVVISGPVTANAGTIDIIANDAVTIAATVGAEGPQSGGDGGSVSVVVARGLILANALVSVKGRNPGSSAGGVLVVEGQRVRIGGRLDADGTGGRGGRVGVRADELIELSAGGAITASTVMTGAGGFVEIMSDRDVTIAGSVTANGGPNTTTGGAIEIEGCALRIEESGALTVLRPNGVNRLTGRESIFVVGRVLADQQTGRNEFRYRNADDPPVVFGDVRPRQIEILDPTLVLCGDDQCGNGRVEPPEACDDGNLLDGDGCSRICQFEIRGDADGDGIVTEADLIAVILEIFDGDGDRVADVGGGTFPGFAGADANRDGRITAADLPAILRLLGT
jgi:cysteine-rich repeat protein